MGKGVLIIGASGTGKSTSIRTLANVGIINVLGKPLPFRGSPKTLVTDDVSKIIATLHNCKANSIVIDDAGYIITNYYLRNKDAVNDSGKRDAYKVFADIAELFWRMVGAIRELPDTKIVYVIMHEEMEASGAIKPKTIGKMLDDKVCLEGMFSIVLRSFMRDGKYYFRTQTSGADVCKSPIEMFTEAEIANDLGYVDRKIREYYEEGPDGSIE
jgi:energy-coupling factor transporter ATP-binding protein EcfA2